MTKEAAQEAAHAATLKEQGMYHPNYERKLYTEEARCRKCTIRTRNKNKTIMQHYKLIKFIALILLDKNDNFKNYYSFNRVIEWGFKVFPITEFSKKLIDEGLIELKQQHL